MTLVGAAALLAACTSPHSAEEKSKAESLVAATESARVAPGLTVFGLGLALMVAPLTATVLAAAPDEVTGTASGINNAVARAGSLLAVAALPMAVGLAGDDYRDPARFDTAYGSAIIACTVLLVLGGVVSWLAVPRRIRTATP